MLGVEAADDGSTAQFALIVAVAPHFWPEMKTLNLRSGAVVAAVFLVAENARSCCQAAPPCPTTRWPACGRHKHAG